MNLCCSIMTTTSSAPRAKRFPIHASVRYRTLNSNEWHNGRTENVSCSGALIAGRRRMEAAEPVDMILPMPAQLSGNAHLQFLCRGNVVRVASPRLPLMRSTFAVRWREISVLNGGEPQPLRKDRMRDDWHALVHDMYNEIAVIVGSSDLLLHVPDDLRRKRVTAIKQACDRAVTLLNALSALLTKKEI
jgi:PilZ domain